MKKSKELELAHCLAASMPTTSRADELIACLEGEVKSRDARIAELEELSVTKIMLGVVPGDGSGHEVYARSVNHVVETLELFDTRLEELEAERDQLRAELAVIKAQEPVAYIPVDRATGDKWPPVYSKGSGKICDYSPLYAAPVAKQVVMPELLQAIIDHCDEGQLPDDLYNSLVDEVARLNAADHAEGGKS